jgi:hypothetical protein
MSNTNSVLKEINDLRQLTLEEQLENFKIAGANFIVALDRYISQIGENKNDK